MNQIIYNLKKGSAFNHSNFEEIKTDENIFRILVTCKYNGPIEELCEIYENQNYKGRIAIKQNNKKYEIAIAYDDITHNANVEEAAFENIKRISKQNNVEIINITQKNPS